MLRTRVVVGSILYYVVNDFDGCGIHKVRVVDVAHGGYIKVIGDGGVLNGEELLIDPQDFNIFETYGAAKNFLNTERFY